jgi:hypothetical protein
MEVKLTGPKTLVLPSPAVAYILDKLSECPFKEVNQLINDIFSQLKSQEIKDEPSNSVDGSGELNGMPSSGPADR